MKFKYTVKEHKGYITQYQVIETKMTFGTEEHEPDTKTSETVFEGTVTDCYSYIKLKEGGYFNI